MCRCLGASKPGCVPGPSSARCARRAAPCPGQLPLGPRPLMVLLRPLSTALAAAAAALGSALFIALNYFYRRRTWSPHRGAQRGAPSRGPGGPYRSITEEQEDRGQRQVLVLGLDGAGKSSLLEALAARGGGGAAVAPASSRAGGGRPTRGFNFMSVSAPCCQIHLLEIGGGEELRRFWCEYLSRTQVLVFVVDSSDRRRLLQAGAELQRLRGAEPQLPLLVLGNKQDKAGALGASELRRALDLQDDRKSSLLAVQLDGGGALRDSCSIQDLLLQLLRS